MAVTPAPRENSYALNLGFEYVGPIAVDDWVEITTDRKVRRISAVGTPLWVGTVVAIRSSLGECTVRVRFNENRQDRIAGANITPGPFVLGPGNTVHPYVPGSVPRHDGTAIGPVAITAATNDAFKIAGVAGTLTAGAARTFAQIAAEINTAIAATGVRIEVDSDGHLNPVGTSIGQSFEIETVTHSANATLGWTAGTYTGNEESHDPAAVAGLVIVGGSAGQAVETLEM